MARTPLRLVTDNTHHDLRQTKQTTAYRFKEPDPDVLMLRDLIRSSRMSTVDISVAAMVSYTTVNNILEVAVRRPHNLTITSILAALGYERQVKKVDKSRREAILTKVLGVKK